MSRSLHLGALAALLVAFACAGPELVLEGPGDEAELERVRAATIHALEARGYPAEGLEARFSGSLVFVEQLADGGTWTDAQFFHAKPYTERVSCRSSAHVIPVSRADFRNSELPLLLVYVLTDCNPDRSWWDERELNAAAADAMKLAREGGDL